MTEIDLNRVKGNYGASYVSFRLSKYCLVRQVTEGTDIGIDLYCESFTNNSKPFLHFWVQVKTSNKKIKISKEKSFASFSFDIKHLLYWYRQPVPVFAFLIPINWPQNTNDIPIYVINITDYMLRNKIPPNRKSLSIKSDMVLQTENDYFDFFNNKVPFTTAAQNITKGAVRKVPLYSPAYIYSVPTGYSIKYIENIMWQLRTTAGITIQDLYNAKKLSQSHNDYQRILRKVLESYRSDKHWEVHYSLGLSYLMEKNNYKARKSFENSLKIIEDDPKINQDEWTHIKRLLQEKIIFCKKKDLNIF